uniref:GATA-type domain-containing protein n=1 Tax=Meloidogyne hapla TaxID=6305 RepID=A0A1I8B416_MELHA
MYQMIKFLILSILYLNINLKSDGKIIKVEVKIKDDWKEKREFIYLKNVKQKDRFVLKTIENCSKHPDSFYENINEFLRLIEVNHDEDTFYAEISHPSRLSPTNQLKKKIVIEIANNEIIQKFLPEFEKRVLIKNKFIDMKNYYETSILYDNLENDKINNDSVSNEKIKYEIKENIENYKNKLLSNYWSELNLIGYKIELLNKNKGIEINDNKLEELKSRIIYIGNEITETIERKKRRCFNCEVNENKQWYLYLKEYYLCSACYMYLDKYGRHRPKEYCNKKDDRHCYICGDKNNTRWYRHSELKQQYLCNTCWNRDYYKKNKNKILKARMFKKKKQARNGEKNKDVEKY